MYKWEEKTRERKEIFKGKVIDVYVDVVDLPDGNTSTRELVMHPGAVGVIAPLSNGKIILVEQFRKPLERPLLEIPAGKMEKGESPEITAKRELEEETGYTAAEMKLVHSFYTSPGFANEIIHLYEAVGVTELEEMVAMDEDEFVEVIEASIEEAEEYIASGRIKDAKTILAIQYVKLQKK